MLEGEFSGNAGILPASALPDAASRPTSLTPYYPLGYNPALDGLRGVAVLIVAVYHVSGLHFGGFLGVDVFFVISGFLITATLQNEYLRAGGISLLSFYKRRIFRLAPALIAICAVVSIFCFSVNYEGRVTDLLFVLTYTVNWAHALGVASPLYLGHAWSLAIEEQFYYFWPVAFAGALSFFGSLAIAAASYRWIEQPVLALRYRTARSAT